MEEPLNLKWVMVLKLVASVLVLLAISSQPPPPQPFVATGASNRLGLNFDLPVVDSDPGKVTDSFQESKIRVSSSRPSYPLCLWLFCETIGVFLLTHCIRYAIRRRGTVSLLLIPFAPSHRSYWLSKRFSSNLRYIRPRWQATINSCSSLAALQRAVRYNGKESPAVVGCRSLCWKVSVSYQPSPLTHCHTDDMRPPRRPATASDAAVTEGPGPL